MAVIILDDKRVLSVDDLCLFGIFKRQITLKSEILNGLELNNDIKIQELLNLCKLTNENNITRDYIIHRMVYLLLIQQALRWKPIPTSLILRLANNLYMGYTSYKIPSVNHNHLTNFEIDGILKHVSLKDVNSSEDVIINELGITKQQLSILNNNNIELYTNLALLTSVLKCLINVSDCTFGLTFEVLSTNTKCLSISELQKLPFISQSLRNLLWLTEDSKLVPKEGGDEEFTSLIPLYLTSSADLRQLLSSLSKIISDIITNICTSTSPDAITFIDKVLMSSISTHVNTLGECLKRNIDVYIKLLRILLSKYERNFQSEDILLPLEEFESNLNTSHDSLSGKDGLELLFKSYKNLIISVTLLNYEMLTQLNKGSSNKKLLGHGNDNYKVLLDTLVNNKDGYKQLNDIFGYDILSYSNDIERILIPQNQKLRKPKIPKGTLDHMPSEMIIYSIVINSIKDVFKQHGALEIDTPVFELKETLLCKYGDDQKLIYDLKDQGGEQLSLRYDLTVPFARFVATNKINKIKRFHVGKVYRRDEPQLNRGRFREFIQCDLDYAGEYPKMIADSEVIYILIRILRMFKYDGFLVKINHRGILNSILTHCGVDKSLHITVSSSIDKLDKESWDNIQNELVNEKGISISVVDKIKDFVSIHGDIPDVVNILRVKNIDNIDEYLDDMLLLSKYLNAFGVVKDEISFDLSLARGLDYYTGVIFEAVLVGKKTVGSVGAGGRYDDLIGMFSGKNIPSVGLSVGIDRILRTLIDDNNDSNLTDVLVCTIGDPSMILERMKLCNLLWNNDIRAEFLYNPNANLRKQIDTATDKGVSLLVIVGETELSEGVVRVKFLEGTTSEIVVKREDLVSTLRSILLDRDSKISKLERKIFSKY